MQALDDPPDEALCRPPRTRGIAKDRQFAESEGLGQMKALVVDDSAVMRKVLIGGLARAGITDVMQAADGREAVEAVREHDFDLVLLDWNMPVMLGIDALRIIRAEGKRMPIIIVTTEAEKSRVMEALKAGATNYIIKPFEPTTFVAKIRGALEHAVGG